MSQGEQKESITHFRKWNLIAGGSDPKNDVVPASVSYGLEEGLQFAASEILRLEDRIKRLEEAGDALCAAAAFMGWHMEIEKWNKAKEAKL